MEILSMVPQIRPSSTAPQKVLEGFHRNRFLLGAASNLTLSELLSGLGGMTGHSQPCAALGSVPGLEVGGREEHKSRNPFQMAVPKPFSFTHFILHLRLGIPPIIYTRAP